MSYLKNLLDTFEEQPADILCTAFLIWAIFPVLIFALGGIFLLLRIINLDSFTNLFSNAIIPWWTSMIINFWEFMIVYLIFIILTLILIHHEIVEPINFKWLIEKLRRL